MTHRFIVGGGPLYDGRALHPDGAMLVDDGAVAALGPVEAIRRHHEAPFIDVRGRLIVPGFLNAHTHLYSSLAAGLAPLGSTDTFRQTLTNLWWPLDAAHDEESIYYSALIGIMGHIRAGTTTIFDHHASMNSVCGSLEIIAGAVRECGVRATLCFETSERTGRKAVSDHIAENVDFFEANRHDAFVGGTMGLHASLTLGDESLSEIAASRPVDMPIHVHVGEAPEDLHAGTHDGSEGPIDRLCEHRLLDEHSLLVHAIHLSHRDTALLAEIEPQVVVAPQSNANNGVGHPDPVSVPRYLIGTDGMSADMIETLRYQHLFLRSVRAPQAALRDAVFEHAARARSHHFPGTGRLFVGSRADAVVLDYAPVTELHEDNLVDHLVFGAKRAVAHMTIVDGRVLFENGRFTGLDEDRIRSHARRVAAKLHARFYG
ncbi:MAG: amidohydrolase family protein [Spirochaetota bacterium]